MLVAASGAPLRPGARPRTAGDVDAADADEPAADVESFGRADSDPTLLRSMAFGHAASDPRPGSGVAQPPPAAPESAASRPGARRDRTR